MPIQDTDIKLLASERMTDAADGGGRRTANVIVSGTPGNIFAKVSRLDGVYGRDNLRKVFAHVDSPNTETYAGAHAAIIDAPDNDRIHVTIFSTASEFDTRTQARDRIESYVVSGPESRMILYGRQLIGQQAVTTIQRSEEPVPEVGEVFCLSKEAAGVVAYQQYIRVEDVKHELRTFTDEHGDFARRVVTLMISTPLRYEFVGWETVSRYSATARSALVRSTSVADASRYFGVMPLAQPAVAGALEAMADGIFAPIVPTTQRETAVNLAQALGTGAVLPAALAPLPYRNIGTPHAGFVGSTKTQTIELGMAIAPGTLSLRVDGQGVSAPSGTVTDDALGGIPVGAVANGNQILGGTVDYESGAITVTSQWTPPGGLNWAGYVVARWTPGAVVSQPAHTMQLPMTLETRGTVFSVPLQPLPALGTCRVDYRALGKWYTLRDSGNGELSGGDDAYGTGTVDPVTGGLLATLGALPDIGSSVIISWGSGEHFEILVGAAASAEANMRMDFTLTNAPLDVGTLALDYVMGGVARAAATTSAGVITGYGLTGVVDQFGRMTLYWTTGLPDQGTEISCTYSEMVDGSGAPASVSGAAAIGTAGGNFITVPDVVAGSLRVDVAVRIPASWMAPAQTIVLPVQDDALGGLVVFAQVVLAGQRTWQIEQQTIGSINYVSGEVNIVSKVDAHFREWRLVSGVNGDVRQWETGTIALDYDNASNAAWKARSDAAPILQQFNQSFLVPFPAWRFVNGMYSSILPGSLVFSAFGAEYMDRAGKLFTGGAEVGTVDYDSGRAVLSTWPGGVNPELTLLSCLGKIGDFSVRDIVFRTAGSPVRSASTFIQATTLAGELLTATTDVDGNVTSVGSRITGSINQQMGIAGLTFDTDVAPSTVRYSTVVLSNLPVNADILGLDPVRLPSDGRVPIFRPGDVVLFHNTKWTQLENPATAGATYSMLRAGLAECVLYDAADTLVPADQYVVDLAAGTVTMSAALDLGALVQPLKARHRIEELTLATDVQINGQITLAAQLSRDFDADSLVSSCLLFGDMFARVTSVFDQTTWLGAWSDSMIGGEPAGEYDVVNYPIEVSNAAAVSERWRINFTSADAFQVIGENLGVIATGTRLADCSPVNTLTGAPYFTLRAAGWGGGWAAGNQLRFNTVGASAPIWMLRTVLPGATLDGDSIDLQVRGDVDA